MPMTNSPLLAEFDPTLHGARYALRQHRADPQSWTDGSWLYLAGQNHRKCDLAFGWTYRSSHFGMERWQNYFQLRTGNGNGARAAIALE